MIHVILFHDSGGFQPSILSVTTYMNEGGSKLLNDAQCASIPPTNLKNNKILACKINDEDPVYCKGLCSFQCGSLYYNSSNIKKLFHKWTSF